MEELLSYCTADLDELNRRYHDSEWGFPTHDDRQIFEFLFLESMQAGLSWTLMLRKREIFRSCFDGFDYERIAKYDESDVERIMNTEGMIRSTGKIRAMINNAGCFVRIRERFGSFDEYIWSFTDKKTVLYPGHEKGIIPAKNGLSERISRDLKKRGFKYVGPVIVYSFLQALGIINDHVSSCPCYERINRNYPTVVLDNEEE